MRDPPEVVKNFSDPRQIHEDQKSVFEDQNRRFHFACFAFQKEWLIALENEE